MDGALWSRVACAQARSQRRVSMTQLFSSLGSARVPLPSGLGFAWAWAVLASTLAGSLLR